MLVAASYNAGPHRAERWIERFGDPRSYRIDVIDWIEHIPFRETRNYVMRVTEGIPVYRARLNGGTGALRFHDLLIGAPPVIRPQARPEGLGVVETPERPPVRRGGELGPSAPQPPQGVRPIARPGGG